MLIPHDQPQDVLLEILRETQVDRLVAPAGTIPMGRLQRACPCIKEAIWVVEETSRQLDWKSPSSSLTASTWHDVIEAGQKTVSDSPPESDDVPVPAVAAVETGNDGKAFEIVEYSQQVNTHNISLTAQVPYADHLPRTSSPPSPLRAWPCPSATDSRTETAPSRSSRYAPSIPSSSCSPAFTLAPESCSRPPSDQRQTS